MFIASHLAYTDEQAYMVQLKMGFYMLSENETFYFTLNYVRISTNSVLQDTEILPMLLSITSQAQSDRAFCEHVLSFAIASQMNLWIHFIHVD